ncbi:hypothetical protein LOZ80_00005 [Paenibacillus sp. HWE-109]|uniref:hypothetical protein n=1 Tax=Paenibacillus sp. HWE-109 TaxID=1306526 RepID=UPI001EE0A5C1|nr:hypothetical protein [Paenibacillus sp. HWE-109]UKS27375.1 hypothetical protein LOZ80_00005 [Paenibacillus sp. HWE-109]
MHWFKDNSNVKEYFQNVLDAKIDETSQAYNNAKSTLNTLFADDTSDNDRLFAFMQVQVLLYSFGPESSGVNGGFMVPKLVRPEAAVTGSKKHGVSWKEGPARAINEGKPQGQWNKEDLDYATTMANTLKSGESGYFDLPTGSKSIVYMPDGTTTPATKMWVRNNGTGTWHGYPMP